MQLDFNNDDNFDHTVVLVDKTTMTFAQHSYDGYRVLWQYTGAKRYFNPSYFKEML